MNEWMNEQRLIQSIEGNENESQLNIHLCDPRPAQDNYIQICNFQN